VNGPNTREWEESRKAIDKFDGMLIDLRKYGFSFLTGLIAAGSLLGVAAENGTEDQFVRIQIAVIIVTMILVITLYWLDIYYETMLTAAVISSEFVEKYKLKMGLSAFIASFYLYSHLGGILKFLYILFLAGLPILGIFVLDFKWSNYTILLLVGFVLCLSFMLYLWRFYDRTRYKKYKNIAEIFFSASEPIEPSYANQVEECILQIIQTKDWHGWGSFNFENALKDLPRLPEDKDAKIKEKILLALSKSSKSLKEIQSTIKSDFRTAPDKSLIKHVLMELEKERKIKKLRIAMSRDKYELRS
jgi:hypothetical protein